MLTAETVTPSYLLLFLLLPRNIGLRRRWEVVVRMKGFGGKVIYSEHYKPEDFDRMSQIVRFRDGPTSSSSSTCHFTSKQYVIFFLLPCMQTVRPVIHI